jgi:hypothetical protein
VEKAIPIIHGCCAITLASSVERLAVVNTAPPTINNLEISVEKAGCRDVVNGPFD